LHLQFRPSIISHREDEASYFAPRTPIQTALTVLRRQYALVIGGLVLALGLGLAYFALTPPVYTAVVTMMIDSRRGGIQQKSVLGDPDLTDSAWIDSQIGVLMLERYKIGQTVAATLPADPDPALLYEGNVFSELKGRIDSLLNQPRAALAPKSEAERAELVVAAIGNGLAIRRVGLTYLVNVTFTSHSQTLTAQIANAAADAYVLAELKTKDDDLRRASSWLQQRYEALRDQASAADRAVIDFKDKNSIITSDEKLFTDQMLSRINSALAAAHEKTAEQQARLDQISAVINTQATNAGGNATVSEALLSPIVTKYRTQYLDIMRRLARLTKLLGPKHLAVVDLQNQANSLQAGMNEELKRLAEGAKSDLEVALREEEQLLKQQETMLQKIPNDAQIKLRALEASAQSYHTFYDQFFLRYTEAIQQESQPFPVAHVISNAPAAFKSDPSEMRVLSLFTLAGGVLGFGAGLLREMVDHVFRTRLEVENILKRDCIAMIPQVRSPQIAPGYLNSIHLPVINADVSKRVFTNHDLAVTTLIHAPFSEFSEATRALKLAADFFRKESDPKVIGVTSTLTGEGKSTIASALAGLAGLTGSKVILLDCDLCNPTLTRALTPDAREGLFEVLSGSRMLSEVVWTDFATEIDFLPAGNVTRLANTMEVFRSDAMKALLDRLRNTYKYIIVDLSPLRPVVDVRATTDLIDFYFYVIEWGATRVDVVNEALRGAPEVYEKVNSIVLNKVDVNVIGRYCKYQIGYDRDAWLVKAKGKSIKAALPWSDVNNSVGKTDRQV